jgi:hypothetical protein
MDVSEVFYVLREFVLAGLIDVWKDGDKIWGSFTGMDKPGRLPGVAILERYKNLPPCRPARTFPLQSQLNCLETLLKRCSHPITPVPIAPECIKINDVSKRVKG